MNSRKLTLATAAVLALALLSVLGYQLVNPTADIANAGSPDGYAGQPTLGRADAPVKMILFENFLCDHCKAFEAEVFPRIRSEFIDTGQVQAFYINLAWGSQNATTAGLAGECAYTQDEEAFWDYKSALYAAQSDHSGEWATTSNLVNIARDSAPTLAADDLRSCIEEERYLTEVQRDLELGDTVGVSGTPSVIIGNLGYEGPGYDTVAAAINEQLAQQE